jgi:hypothetical protein
MDRLLGGVAPEQPEFRRHFGRCSHCGLLIERSTPVSPISLCDDCEIEREELRAHRDADD